MRISQGGRMMIDETGVGKSHANMKDDEIIFKELEAYKSSTDLVERYINKLRQNGSIDQDMEQNSETENPVDLKEEVTVSN